MFYKVRRFLNKVIDAARNAVLRSPKAAYTLEGWSRYERRIRKLHPIRYWLTHKFYFWWYGWFVRRPGNVLYWIRTHTYNRYHMIDCRNYEYKWGWCDRDHLLLYAMMKILDDFIEKEHAFIGMIGWDHDEGHRHARATMLDIQDWWKNRRPAKQKRIDDMTHEWATRDGGLFDRIHELEKELHDEEQTMMERLISVRDYMWT